MRKGKATQRPELINESNYAIVLTYQLEYQGFVNYYRLAFNLHTARKLKWVMQTSLLKTLADKHRTTVNKVVRKYEVELVVDGERYKGLQVKIPRQDKEPLVATWGGISLKWDIKATIEEQPPRIWNTRTELVARLLAQFCYGKEPPIPPIGHGDENEHGTAQEQGLRVVEPVRDITNPLRSPKSCGYATHARGSDYVGVSEAAGL